MIRIKQHEDKNRVLLNLLLKIIRFYFIYLIFLLGSESYSQSPISFQGSRSSAIGNASVTLQDKWAVNNNQAALLNEKYIGFGLSFENSFLIKELSSKSFVLVIPAKNSVYGFSFSRFGYNLFNETKIGLALAKKLTKNFDAGIKINYNSIHIAENYGNDFAFTVEGGFLAHINEYINLGFHFYNPNNVSYGNDKTNKFPSSIKLGIDYKFSDKLLFAVNTYKDLSNTATANLGIEYLLANKFYLRGGLSTNPTIHSIGFGYNYKGFDINFATTHHYLLGYSPNISVDYNIK